jgi:hypothetical protein
MLAHHGDSRETQLRALQACRGSTSRASIAPSTPCRQPLALLSTVPSPPPSPFSRKRPPRSSSVWSQPCPPRRFGSLCPTWR